MVRRLKRLNICRHFILFVCIPLGILQQWKLTGKVADAFEIAVSKAQNTVSLHQRYSGENIVCDIAATVHNDIGCDLSQPIQQLYCLLFGKRRNAVLIFTLE